MIREIFPKNSLKGTFSVPGDKSISHRSIMLGSIASGKTDIYGFLMGADCLSTIDCFRKMGIDIDVSDEKVTVYGKGMNGLKAPTDTLDVGNSGTTMRLMTGILSAQKFNSKVTGDSSIQKRPMNRVSIPLKEMGAVFKGEKDGKLFAPFEVVGQNLKGIHYTLPVASAQVKSAIILAGLYADGETVITEPEKTRDHTEIMLNYLGADIKHVGNDIICKPVKELYGKTIHVPADISSAAYFMVAGLICENSHIVIENVGINPTRTGIITVLKNMGGNIEIKNERTVCGELVADIEVKSSKLKGTVIEGDLIPKLIDEIPVLAVAGTFAEGTTIVRNAEELKVKESNRIKTVKDELTKLGADIVETDDGMIINGVSELKGAETESHNDHRIAMSIAIAGLKASGKTTILNSECVDISFPKFYDYIEKL